MRELLCALLIASAMLAAIGCSDEPKPAKAETPATSVALLSADTMTVDAPLSLPSQLYVEHDAIVAARSSGMVEAVLADLGARVEAGQLLARLESVDQEIAVGQAENAYSNAERLVQRARELTHSGAATVADSEQAEMQDRQAELAVKKARLRG
jgi:multidrug efflux pump subunit AcrA (membrane-fusion protein)